jgi:tetratricopeptide (TPR) repeat protein
VRRPNRRTRGIVLAAAVLVTLGAGYGVYAARARRTPPLDASAFVVLPFRQSDRSSTRRMTGDQAELLMADALSRWKGVRVVPSQRVDDALLRVGTRAVDVTDALRAARQLGAARLAWGDVRPAHSDGDSVEILATLYDVGSGRTIRAHHVRVASDPRDAGRKFDELADSLLLGSGHTPLGIAGAMGTRLLSAWEAYDRGHAALHEWDLPRAVQEFRAATTLDPEYPQAQLWLAQSKSWSGEGGDELRQSAARAVALRAQLAPRDRALASALAALASGNYPAACREYDTLRARDTLDFAAWYGLGQCHSLDVVVVSSASSPSGYAFRGSYRAALAAYRQALRLVPAMHLAYRGLALGNLEELLYTEPQHARLGRGQNGEGLFAAFVSLDHDTIAFIPRPRDRVFAGEPGTIPATLSDAVVRNRKLLRDIAAHWVQTFPGSADAHESLARASELTGQIAATGPGDSSAVTSLRRARDLSRDSVQQLRLAITDTRLRVKTGRFADARALADSLLRARLTPSPTDARSLAGLAALTGRTDALVGLLRRSASSILLPGPAQPEHPPAPVSEAAAALLGFAVMGAPADSITTLARALDQRVREWVGRGEQASTRSALMDVAMELAFPAVGMGPVPGPPASDSYLRALERDLAARRYDQLRAGFARLDSQRANVPRSGDVAIDGTYVEAWLLASMGDTTAAARRLDRTLESLPTLGTDLMEQIPQTAALPRAMTLRADLAARTGDAATARRWASAVVALWSGANPSLQATVARMRSYASR